MAKCTLELIKDRLPIPLTLNPLSALPLMPLSLDDMPIYTPTPISSDDTGGDTPLTGIPEEPSRGGPTPPYQAGLVFSSQFFGEMVFIKNRRKVLSFQRLGSIYGKNFSPRFFTLTADLRQELEKRVENAWKWFGEAKGIKGRWRGTKHEREYFMEYLVKGMNELKEAEKLWVGAEHDNDIVYLWKVYRALKDFLNFEGSGKERPKDLPFEGVVAAIEDRKGGGGILRGSVPDGLASDLVYRPHEAALYPEGVTQGTIYKYYRDVTPWLMPLLKGYPLIVVIKADDLIYRQRKDKSSEEIVIDSFEDYEYWNTGRTVSFYYRNPDETNVVCLEFRPEWEYPEEVLKETVMEAIERLYEGQAEGLETISLMANGDRGYILTLSFEKVESGQVLKERVMGWIRNMVQPDESLILKEGSIACQLPKGGGQDFQGLKHSTEISWALRTLIPELREHGFEGDIQSVNVAVDDLPEGKLGKTDDDGNIFLSPKLFQEGMREILKDVLFHEIMHLKQRSNPENKFRDVEEREEEVLDEERSRLREKGLKPKEIEHRVEYRTTAVKTNLFSRAISAVKGFFKKADDAMNNREWNSDTTNWPVNPNTEQQGEAYYPTKKNRGKGPAFWYPTGTPADFIASPAASIYVLEYFHDKENDIVEVQLVWEKGDFEGDKKEDIIRALQADLKAKFDGLRDLREDDCSVFDAEDRSAEFYIVNAFKGENKQQEQEGEVFDIKFGENTYKVSVTIIQGKPVTRFEDGHHPELKEEEVSAIYSIALRQYAEKTEGPKEEGLKADKKGSLYGWVSPDGKFHDAPKSKGGHSAWILTHPEVLDEYNVPEGKIYSGAPLDRYDYILDNGWLRVMDEGVEVGTLNWIEKAAEFIQKNPEQFPEDVTIDVFVGKNAHPVSVPKESIIDQGADAIWRAFKTRTASIDVKSMLIGWLDPKGNFFEIGDLEKMHMEWVEEHRSDLERNYGIVFPEGVSLTYDVLLDNGWVRVFGGNFQIKNLETSVIENLERFILAHKDEFSTVWLDYIAGGRVSLTLSVNGIEERGLMEEIKASRTMERSRAASLALRADMNTVFKTKFLALVFLKKYLPEMEAEDQSLYRFFVTDLLEELDKDIKNAEAMIRARVDRGGDFPKALEVIEQTKEAIETRSLEEIIVAINKLINFSHSSGSILEYFSTEGERQPQNVVIDSIINFTMLSESDDPYYLFMRWLPGDYKYLFKKYAQYEFVFGPQKAEWDKDIENLMTQLAGHKEKEGVENFLKYMQEQINDREVPRKRIITTLGKALAEIGESGKISNPTPSLG